MKKNTYYYQYVRKTPIFCAKQQNTSNLKKILDLHQLTLRLIHRNGGQLFS
tara:strand:+ start:168 stop:320 length:153 start_codon:yes stop_codon:yes gene_type:complete